MCDVWSRGLDCKGEMPTRALRRAGHLAVGKRRTCPSLTKAGPKEESPSVSSCGAMALNIKDVETDQLARRLATLTGESLTVAIKIAVRERIEREERIRGKASVGELLATVRRIAEAPNRDDRTDDEILGYHERGLPG